MNNKIWVENNKTSTLEKEYQLDPKQVGLDHVTPKPAENKYLNNIYFDLYFNRQFVFTF